MVGGKTILYLQCRDGNCRGRVRLLPRGRSARRKVGAGAIANQPVSLDENASEGVRLRLSGAARNALRGRKSLNVTIDLTTQRGASEVTDSSVLYVPKLVALPGKPDSVQTGTAPNGAGGSDTTNKFSWHFEMNPGAVAYVPEFSCPSETPNVATNGQEVKPKKEDKRIGLRGNLTAERSSSWVGYSGFNVPTTQLRPGVRGSYPDYDAMVGWPKGDWTFNSIWGDPGIKSTFDLTVVCTSATDRDSIAYVDHQVIRKLLFPWGTQ